MKISDGKAIPLRERRVFTDDINESDINSKNKP